MQDMIGLDFETFGAESLPKHGLHRYVNDPSFLPLMAGWATAGGSTPSTRWDRGLVSLFQREQRDFTLLRDLINGRKIVAHNAPFEQAVLGRMGIERQSSSFIDSAVVARAAGASGHLAGAAPQLLGTAKLDGDGALMKRFSIPDEGVTRFDPQLVVDWPQEWKQYGEYCMTDAELGLRIVTEWSHVLTMQEHDYTAITMDMNQQGWSVDVDLVQEMQRRYLENMEVSLEKFRAAYDLDGDLNLNSLKQLKEWCSERGVKCTSFDEKHVDKYILLIEQKLVNGGFDFAKRNDYHEVLALLKTKQALGGASLKKLQTILDTQFDGRLKDQYLHCGAGQSLRTTGRSVQMQNLKRLSGGVADMSELSDDAVEWDNDMLAANIRQVFKATNPGGRLIVGDFSSVESRGLAMLAGATWKVDAYRASRDMYKVLATQMFSVHYDQVTKDQRQAGKVGELACGYGAGPDAVREFAEGMGIRLEPAEATKLVYDWREINSEIVDWWHKLDSMLHGCIENGNHETMRLFDGLTLYVDPWHTPASLRNMHPDAQSIQVWIEDSKGEQVMKRFFHGCYIRGGRDICYYKPSDRKTGDLWSAHFMHPKTKQLTWYKIYGGKLAGIITQSFCRELFFESLLRVDYWVKQWPGALQLVGQFHDEIVLDWTPGHTMALETAKFNLEHLMSTSQMAPSFPLAAEIKDDYRYTK